MSKLVKIGCAAPPGSGRGLSLTLAPGWGATGGGAARLSSVHDAQEFVSNEDFDAETRFDAELGYGFSVLGDRGVATPHAGWSQSQDGGTLRLGQRLRLRSSEWSAEGEFGAEARTFRAGYGYRLGNALDLNLEATRREAANDDKAEHGLILRAGMRW